MSYDVESSKVRVSCKGMKDKCGSRSQNVSTDVRVEAGVGNSCCAERVSNSSNMEDRRVNRTLKELKLISRPDNREGHVDSGRRIESCWPGWTLDFQGSGVEWRTWSRTSHTSHARYPEGLRQHPFQLDSCCGAGWKSIRGCDDGQEAFRMHGYPATLPLPHSELRRSKE